MELSRDMRSAAYARHRSYDASRPTCGFRGIRDKAEDRLLRKRAKQELLSYELNSNQRRQAVWSSGKPKRIEFLDWDVYPPEEFDKHISDMNDDVIRYEKLNMGHDIFETDKAYSETGETFTAWAQRRIAEMREVKEARIRDAQPLIQQPLIFSKSDRLRQSLAVREFRYTIYCGSSITTTLPTNSYDAFGHAVLRAALTPTKWMQKRARQDPTALFPRIKGNEWFGEYSWKWHRNASGCWQIGYDDCGGCSIPCPCCNYGNGSMYYTCYCDIFEDDLSAPDEQQLCSLVEWVDPTGRRIIMANDHDRHVSHIDGTESDKDSEWSLIDEQGDVQSVSSWSSII